MELRLLNYFLAVAREQSISAAAQSLHISQPALSTQLKLAEQELGKQLLIRGSKGSRKVTLTEEGMILKKRAEEILSLVKKTEDEISRSDETVIGDIYIGAGETDIIRLFARVARSLQKKYPDIHYHISSGNAEYVLEYLDKGLIDFGLLFGDVDTRKYEAIPLPVKDTWGVLMRRDAPLAQKEVICPVPASTADSSSFILDIFSAYVIFSFQSTLRSASVYVIGGSFSFGIHIIHTTATTTEVTSITTAVHLFLSPQDTALS